MCGFAVTAGPAGAARPPGQQEAQIGALAIQVQSLDGSGNNAANPSWGQGGTQYARVAAANYADGRSAPVGGPNTRYISNRVFNDQAQNLFSEHNVTQWGFVWGQFLDHTFGLRLGAEPFDPQGETANIPFNRSDPLEDFTNDLGVIPFQRSAAAPGTGVNNARQQINTVSSYIDAAVVYGGSTSRLEWLREGSVDGNIANNSARLLLSNQYLPRRDARGNASAAPFMETPGRLAATPGRAAVGGDVRANENIGLLATQTLFAREHNRIVGLLPSSLSEEEKFQIARRVVIAEEQAVTYQEFLPMMGIRLPSYNGYNPNTNSTLTNEFATVGYRAHSQIHGEFEVEADVARYSQATLNRIEAQGAEVEVDGDEVEFAIPLNVAFGNPDLLTDLQLGPMLEGIGGESQYNNDEMIDNQLRSILFQIPVSGNPECLDGPTLPQCFRVVNDLGAIDTERDRDHGMPTYNQLRQAYGLAPRTSFTQITGESSDQFPAGTGVDNRNSLAFAQVRDFNGDVIPAGDADALDAEGNFSTRGAPLAARLRAIYNGNVNSVDAFVGMLAEPHQAGSEFGELQRAIWTREFQRLRDGDRFFYAGNTANADLTTIRNTYGIDYLRNLGDIVAANTDIPRAELSDNVFAVNGEEPPTSCSVRYNVTTQWPGGFQVALTLNNTGSTPITGWSVRWTYADGQTISQSWDSTNVQGRRMELSGVSYNRNIGPGGSLSGPGFNGVWNNATNSRPTSITLNTTRCTIQ
ncbi:peroxidase family protein [Flindersiella endophytica]